jgi:WD repeat-containing protein 89
MSDASLVESPFIKTTSRPLKTYKLADSAYALSLASLPGCYAASASAPSNIIDLIDKTTLKRVQTLRGHEEAVTSLKTVNSIVGHVGPSLVSSGKDGSVKVWDGRTSAHSIKSA